MGCMGFRMGLQSKRRRMGFHMGCMGFRMGCMGLPKILLFQQLVELRLGLRLSWRSLRKRKVRLC